MTRILRTEDWFHDDGFPIVVERREPQEPFGMHAHEFSELVVVTGGHGVHITEDESWPLMAGDVFVINDRRPHDYQNMENLSLINIMYLPGRLQMPVVDLNSLSGYHALFSLEPMWRTRHRFRSRLHLASRELAAVVDMIDRLDEELVKRRPGFGLMSLALLMQIIGFLSRCYARSTHPDSKSLLRIADAIVYMEKHFTEEISLEQIAEIAGMAKRSFLRDFQKAIGTSPIAHLLNLRIRESARLLRTGDLSISEIAFRSGFSDSNYFSRQFKKIMGISPREYRQGNFNLPE